MSFWYDVKNKNYSSNGKGSWLKAYADRIVSLLRSDCETKFGEHFAGVLGRHKASDVDCDNGTTVQTALDMETADRIEADEALADAVELEKENRENALQALDDKVTTEINNRISEVDSIYSVIDTKAPISHSTSLTTYGTGTSTSYGHVKIADNLTTSSSSGVALSAAQGKVLNDSKAPNSHASTSTTYGMGTETNYGHVKVINDLTSTLKSGAALSPFQGRLLKYAVDAIPAETMNGTYEIKPDGTTQSGTLGVRIGDRRNRKWINGFNYTEGNVATGDYSVAMGRGNTVTGLGALSIGTSNFCDGGNSFVWGFSNNANGANSFVGGGFNTAKNNQLKIGWCAKDGNGNNGGGTGGDAFIIGNGNYSIVQEDGTSDYANPTLTQSNAFRVAYNGSVYGGAAYNSSGADIAELYEWQDGNPEGEDRRGLFVTLDGTKIRLANEDDTYIKGAISARPCLVGDSASEDWHGKYMTDVFGALLTQTVHHDAIYKGVEKIDPETGEKKVEKELVSEEYDSVEFILNPEYNDEEEYIPREKRPEYDYVSSWGKIVLVDDGSCEVNGFAKPGKAGKATKSEEQTIYRVMKRIDENHIFVAVG